MKTLPLDSIPSSHRIQSIIWCTQTLGPAGTRWDLIELSKIAFYQDKDCTMFLLRWSSSDSEV